MKHLIISKYKNKTSEPPLSHLENLTILNIKGRGQVSLFYTALITHDKESTTDRLEAWRLDLKEDIEKTDWENTGFKAQRQSIRESNYYNTNSSSEPISPRLN